MCIAVVASAIIVAAAIWVVSGRFETLFSTVASSQSATLKQMDEKLTEIAETIAKSRDDAPDFEPVFWTQLYPDQMWDGISWGRKEESGRLLARAIVPIEDNCPSITVDGRSGDMKRRHLIYPTNFPVKLCEGKAPYAGLSDAFISSERLGDDKVRLARWSGSADKILLIGDTGCRVTYYPPPQPCEKQEEALKGWPFPKIAEQASQIEDFDLVIHIGDYHYRERPCPVSQEDTCGKHSGGYVWAAWESDFFAPARKLLARAPVDIRAWQP